MTGLAQRVYVALALFGDATDADLVARLREIAEQRGRSVSATSVVRARQRLVRCGAVVAGRLGRATAEGRETRRWQAVRKGQSNVRAE